MKNDQVFERTALVLAASFSILAALTFVAVASMGLIFEQVLLLGFGSMALWMACSTYTFLRCVRLARRNQLLPKEPGDDR